MRDDRRSWRRRCKIMPRPSCLRTLSLSALTVACLTSRQSARGILDTPCDREPYKSGKMQTYHYSPDPLCSKDPPSPPAPRLEYCRYKHEACCYCLPFLRRLG